MPIEVLQSGYIGSISYHRDSVKIEGKIFSNVFNENSSHHSKNEKVNKKFEDGVQNSDRDVIDIPFKT